MQDNNEYMQVLRHLYGKSLVLHDTGSFNRVLWFYFIDSLAHIDYTASLCVWNYESPKNIMSGEYLRWRIDEEKRGDREKFTGFVNWLRENRPEKFSNLPSLWQMIYDSEDSAGYRSFRIVLDPESRNPVPADYLFAMIDEFFEPEFLKSLYEGASLSSLFNEYCAAS